MKILRFPVPTSTLAEFAGANNLELHVRERGEDFVSLAWIGPGGRFYAAFSKCETADGDGLLRGEFGNGATEQEATENYAKAISEKTLIYDAWGPERKEIKVPRITSVE